MNSALEKFNQKDLYGRNARLWQEWADIDNLCTHRREISDGHSQPSISYIIRRLNQIGLPTKYEIVYRCKSIVGIKEEAPREPIFGYEHRMFIELPNNYPAADGNPSFKFKTDVWHPNIRYAGSFKGRVCLTINEMGTLASLKDLILRVERYLKYEMYHAKNFYPYPEDQSVAEWVREEGEPNGWIKFRQPDAKPDDSAPVDAAPVVQQPETPVESNVTKPKRKLSI